MVLNICRRSLRQFLAEVQNTDFITNTHDQLHIVLDKQNGDAPIPYFANHLCQFHFFVVIHAGCRLIQQKQFRVADNGPRNLQSSLFTLGEIFRQKNALHNVLNKGDEGSCIVRILDGSDQYLPFRISGIAMEPEDRQNFIYVTLIPI